MLEAGHEQDPANRDILIALIQYNAKLADEPAARRWLDVLRAAAPGDPVLLQIEEQIRDPEESTD